MNIKILLIILITSLGGEVNAQTNPFCDEISNDYDIRGTQCVELGQNYGYSLMVGNQDSETGNVTIKDVVISGGTREPDSQFGVMVKWTSNSGSIRIKYDVIFNCGNGQTKSYTDVWSNTLNVKKINESPIVDFNYTSPNLVATSGFTKYNWEWRPTPDQGDWVYFGSTETNTLNLNDIVANDYGTIEVRLSAENLSDPEYSTCFEGEAAAVTHTINYVNIETIKLEDCKACDPEQPVTLGAIRSNDRLGKAANAKFYKLQYKIFDGNTETAITAPTDFPNISSPSSYDDAIKVNAGTKLEIVFGDIDENHLCSQHHDVNVYRAYKGVVYTMREDKVENAIFDGPIHTFHNMEPGIYILHTMLTFEAKCPGSLNEWTCGDICGRDHQDAYAIICVQPPPPPIVEDKVICERIGNERKHNLEDFVVKQSDHSLRWYEYDADGNEIAALGNGNDISFDHPGTRYFQVAAVYTQKNYNNTYSDIEGYRASFTITTKTSGISDFYLPGPLHCSDDVKVTDPTDHIAINTSQVKWEWGDGQYDIFDKNTGIPNAATHDYNLTSNASFEIKRTITYQCDGEQKDISTKTYHYILPPVNNMGDIVGCKGNSIQLTAEFASGNAPDEKIYWFTSPAGVVDPERPSYLTDNNNDDNILNVTLPSGYNKSYIDYYAVSYDSEKKAQSCKTQFRVNLKDIPIKPLLAKRGCYGNVLYVSNTADYDSYQWYRYENSQFIAETDETKSFIRICTTDKNGKYAVTGIIDGCPSSLSPDDAIDVAYRVPVLDFDWVPICTDKAGFIDKTLDIDGYTSTYTWDFGDGSPVVNERNPVHVFPEPPAGQSETHTVTLTIKYNCEECPEIIKSIPKDITIPINFSVEDVDVNINLSNHNKVLGVSSATFSDTWLMNPNEISDNLEGTGEYWLAKNAYANGQKGAWKPLSSFVYDEIRKGAPDMNTQVDLSEDGILYDEVNATDAIKMFSWQNNGGTYNKKWKKVNTVTEYSGIGNELENRDILDRFSSAIYGYEGQLAIAVGANMQKTEMAFTGFETDVRNNTYYGNDLGNFSFHDKPLSKYHKFKVLAANRNVVFVEDLAGILEKMEGAKMTVSGMTLGADNGGGVYNAPEEAELFVWEDITLDCVFPGEDSKIASIWGTAVSDNKIWQGYIGGYEPNSAFNNNHQWSNISNEFAHTGKSSIKANNTKYRQHHLNLIPDKKYVLSAWMKVDVENAASFKDMGNITLNFGSESGNTIILNPSGPIIEGWQRIEAIFTHQGIGNNDIYITFKGGNVEGAPQVYFDDIRLFPESGNMQTYVYDKFYRVQAVLDNNNYATLYYYNPQGNLYLLKKETIRGIKTIQQSMNYSSPNLPSVQLSPNFCDKKVLMDELIYAECIDSDDITNYGFDEFVFNIYNENKGKEISITKPIVTCSSDKSTGFSLDELPQGFEIDHGDVCYISAKPFASSSSNPTFDTNLIPFGRKCKITADNGFPNITQVTQGAKLFYDHQNKVVLRQEATLNEDITVITQGGSGSFEYIFSVSKLSSTSCTSNMDNTIELAPKSSNSFKIQEMLSSEFQISEGDFINIKVKIKKVGVSEYSSVISYLAIASTGSTNTASIEGCDNGGVDISFLNGTGKINFSAISSTHKYKLNVKKINNLSNCGELLIDGSNDDIDFEQLIEKLGFMLSINDKIDVIISVVDENYVGGQKTNCRITIVD